VTRKKSKSSSTHSNVKTPKSEAEALPRLPETVDVVIVGAGPAGLLAAQRERAQHPERSLLMLEAGDRLGGRSQSGLHLLPESFQGNPLLVTGPVLEEALVRWDREWVKPENVKWVHKDWGGLRLPQWDLYFGKRMIPLVGFTADVEGLDLRLQTPVSKLERATDVQQEGWLVETPAGTTLAKQVIWAAGLTGFQNAYGKHETQRYLAANSLYRMEAADYRGGLSLTLNFKVAPVPTEESFPLQALFALPVKHEGTYHLMIGCVIPLEGEWLVQSLTHVHRDTLLDPTAVLSLKKSLRRNLRALFANSEEAAPREKWVVADRVGGHGHGSQWLFGAPEAAEGLEFACDETTDAVRAEAQDTTGVVLALTA
jgi:hypothetical protein